jgi:hypothetical protein
MFSSISVVSSALPKTPSSARASSNAPSARGNKPSSSETPSTTPTSTLKKSLTLLPTPSGENLTKRYSPVELNESLSSLFGLKELVINKKNQNLNEIGIYGKSTKKEENFY